MEGIAMAHRGTECANAVADVVRRYSGARASFGYTGGGHQVAILELNGGRRKQFFPASPSGRDAHKQTARQTRKILTELSKNDPTGGANGSGGI
jgi:hypothetical protein